MPEQQMSEQQMSEQQMLERQMLEQQTLEVTILGSNKPTLEVTNVRSYKRP